MAFNEIKINNNLLLYFRRSCRDCGYVCGDRVMMMMIVELNKRQNVIVSLVRMVELVLVGTERIKLEGTKC